MSFPRHHDKSLLDDWHGKVDLVGIIDPEQNASLMLGVHDKLPFGCILGETVRVVDLGVIEGQ